MPSLNNCITLRLAAILLFLSGCGGGGGSSPTAAATRVTRSLSGTITVAAGSFIDTDVNGPGAPYDSDKDSAHAQALRNPFIVGGFANFFTDPQDYYNIDMAQGQVITLSISDHSKSTISFFFSKIPLPKIPFITSISPASAASTSSASQMLRPGITMSWLERIQTMTIKRATRAKPAAVSLDQLKQVSVNTKTQPG